MAGRKSSHPFGGWFPLPTETDQIGSLIEEALRENVLSEPDSSSPAQLAADQAQILRRLRKSPDRDPRTQVLRASALADEGLKVEALKVLEGLARYGEQDAVLSDAASIGDAGLLADRLDSDELAFRLHHAARRLDPKHANIRQNLADFLLDRDLGEAGVGLLRELVAELRALADAKKQQGEEPWQPLRTAAIELRFGLRRGSPEERESGLAEFMASIRKEIDQADGERDVFRAVVVAAETLSSLAQYDGFRDVVRYASTRFESDRVRRQVLRLLADQLGASDAARDEEEAIDLYWFALVEGHACADPAEMDASDVMHNLATLLVQRDPPTAGYLWSQVYADRKHDDAIQRSFSRFLQRQGSPRAAVSVLESEGLPPETTFVPSPIPDYRGRDAWWLKMISAGGGSCLGEWPT